MGIDGELRLQLSSLLWRLKSPCKELNGIQVKGKRLSIITTSVFAWRSFWRFLVPIHDPRFHRRTGWPPTNVIAVHSFISDH